MPEIDQAINHSIAVERMNDMEVPMLDARAELREWEDGKKRRECTKLVKPPCRREGWRKEGCT